MGSVRTSIMEDLDPYTATTPRPTYTPSTAKSHINDQRPPVQEQIESM